MRFPSSFVARLSVWVTAACVVVSLLGCKFFGKKKGQLDYESIGVDPKQANADTLIQGLAGPARKWKSDAVFYSANFNAVGADGTVDLSAGGKVVYVSPRRVGSALKNQRKDAIKEFLLTKGYARHDKKLNATKGWKNFSPVTLGCSIQQLTTILKDKGLTAGKKVKITYNPKLQGRFVPQPSWRVTGDDPKVDAYYSLSNCDLVKDRLGG